MTVTATIKSNGRALSIALPILAIEVVHQVDRISSATMIISAGGLREEDFAPIDGNEFAPGSEIEILVRESDGPDQQVFHGIVLRTAFRINKQSPEFHVDMRSKAVAMTRVRKSMVFKDKSDSDVMKQLITDNKLSAGKIDSTTEKHPALVQYRVTDWDFLVTRAQVLGMCVITGFDDVSIVPPDLSAQPKLSLELWIDRIIDAELEEDALGQAIGVEAEAWDLTAQKMTAPAKAAEFSLTQGSNKPATAAEVTGKDPDVLSSAAPLTPGELKEYADGALRRNRMSFLRGRLTIPGETKPELLETIEIKGVGARYSGKGLITAIRHEVNAGGWQIDLTLGLDDRRLIDQPDVQETPAGGFLPAVSGLQVGKVMSLADDPDGLNRVEIVIPTLGEDTPPIWARLMMPHAGQDHGFVFRPEIDDEVVVGFANDDPRFPVILGAVYTDTLPELAGPVDEENFEKGIVTRTGARIMISDQDKPAIRVDTPGGNVIMLNDDEQAIKLTDQHGNEIVMNDAGILLKSASDIVIDAAGDLNMVSGGAVSVEASSDVAIKGSAVDMG